MQNSKKNSLKPKPHILDYVNIVTLLIFALVALFPFYYVLIYSFADYAAIQAQKIYLIPTSLNLSAYKTIFSDNTFLNAFKVSVFITVVGTIWSLFICTMTAYVLSRKDLPGKGLIFTIVLIPMFFSGGLIPYYLQVQSLGLIDKIAALIIPASINTFYVILLKNYFDDISPSLEESAKIDGANDLVIFYGIILPISKPILATVTLFFMVDKWNEYYNAMLFINSQKLKPLQLMLREVIQNATFLQSGSLGAMIAKQNSPNFTQTLQMAIIIFTTVPVIIIYPFLQKYFASGLMIGAVKE